MSKLKYLILALTLSTPAAYANYNIYANVGFGGVFPLKNVKSPYQDSSSVVYSPTVIGTSRFILPAVHWVDKFYPGIDANAAIGYKINKKWRGDIEFLFQRFQRKISGGYGWRESYLSGATYAEANDNYITHAQTHANLYSLLFNGYYDFEPLTHNAFVPFIGFGVGLSKFYAGTLSENNILDVDDPTTPLKETAPVLQKSPTLHGTAFTWELKAGLSYQEFRNCTWVLTYRLLVTSPFKASQSSFTSNPNTAGHSTFYVSDYSIGGLVTNALEISVRFNVI